MKKERTSQHLIRVEKIIQEKFMEPSFNVETLAKCVSISKPYLYEIFYNYKQSTPQKAIENRRLEHAALLLKSGNKDLKKISKEAGYARYVTFKRAFKKKYSVNPSEYLPKGFLEINEKQEPVLPEP